MKKIHWGPWCTVWQKREIEKRETKKQLNKTLIKVKIKINQTSVK